MSLVRWVVAKQQAAGIDVANNGERAQRARRDVNRFRDYLGLNPKQREQMDKIMEETRAEFRQLRAETQPRFQAIEMESRNKARAILNDEQLQKYDEFRRNITEKRRQREQRQRPNK